MGESKRKSPDRLTIGQAATRIGVTPSALWQATQSGRIARGDDGRYSPADVDAYAAARRSDPRQEAASVGPAPKLIRPQSSPAQPAPSADSITTDRARLIRAQAAAKELEVERERGQLIERAAVESALFAGGRVIRDRVTALPAELAPRLAALGGNEAAVRSTLGAACRDLLALIADELTRRQAEALSGSAGDESSAE